MPIAPIPALPYNASGSPKPISITPMVSSRFVCDTSSGGSTYLAATAAMIPTGKLIQNNQRQDKLSISTPPSPGPNAGPSATAKPTVPIKRPSCWRLAASLSIACPTGTIKPAASPCKHRATINVVRSRDIPHNTDAAANTRMAATQTRLEPKRRASHAVNGRVRVRA